MSVLELARWPYSITTLSSISYLYLVAEEYEHEYSLVIFSFFIGKHLDT